MHKKNVGRAALVIGNSEYIDGGKLPNAANDAELISKRLEEVGFEVHTYQNLDRAGMDRAIDRFVARLASLGGVDSAIFYYSGHGFQDGGINYLLPCGRNEAAVAYELQSLINKISDLSQRRLVFLDACRHYTDTETPQNEIVHSRGLSPDHAPKIERGLADFDAADNTFISFSAAPGEPAYDGVGGRPNSPYADALARFIHEVDLPLSVLMARVRNSVREDTEHIIAEDGKPAYQKTWDSTSLSSSYFFNPSSLLFLVGNAMAMIAFVVALFTFCVVVYDAAVAEFFGGQNRWLWAVLSFVVLVLTSAVFLFGIGRAYRRVRGETPEWQREGAFNLFKWSSAGSYGAVGGTLGGIIASALVMVPYWFDWRHEDEYWVVLEADCPGYHWAHFATPVDCPRLAQLLVEGSLAGIYILAALGFFSMHFIEWATRGKPARFFELPRPAMILGGSMLGGLLAGIVVGPVITAYFGQFDRPFLEPNFVIPFSVVSVAVMAFCISNYRLETFTGRRLLRSTAGALVGTISAGVALALMVGLLALTGFIQSVVSWAHDGFWDTTKPLFQRYLYLISAGLPYGMVFGLGFGVLIAATKVFTERDGSV